MDVQAEAEPVDASDCTNMQRRLVHTRRIGAVGRKMCSTMHRVLHEGQTPLPVQEKATK